MMKIYLPYAGAEDFGGSQCRGTAVYGVYLGILRKKRGHNGKCGAKGKFAIEANDPASRTPPLQLKDKKEF